MKAILCLLFLVSCALGLQAQNVVFADPNFKAALVAQSFVNTNGDSEIQLSEAAAAFFIDLPNATNISDLGGIENFTNIIAVDLRNNANLTTVDLTNNPDLQVVRLLGNGITTLTLPATSNDLSFMDVRGNQLTTIAWPTTVPNLDSLNLDSNQLTSLTIPTAPQLVELSCDGNQLTSLDISNQPNLEKVDCDNNLLTALTLPTLATTNNILIEELYCRNNRFTSLRFTVPVNLLDCSNNATMDSLWVVSSPVLRIEEVVCNNSALVYIDYSPDIEGLDCSYNNLTKFEILPSTKLRTLDCSHNNMTELNIGSNNSDFRVLNISHNAIDSVRITLPFSTTTFDCSNNNLRVLWINNLSITDFDARNNPNLLCIEVTDTTYARNNWTNIDPGVEFREFFGCLGVWTNTSTISALPNAQLYPNPTTDNVQLDFGQLCNEASIRVYNSLGQLVVQQQINQAHQTTVELPDEKGVYLVQLQTERGLRTFQLIKG
jgi:Leucine-rich repeat (LRR) protein